MKSFHLGAALTRLAPRLAHTLVGLRHLRRNPVSLRREDPAFGAAFERVRGRTLVDAERAFLLWELSRAAAATGGALAEVGVYQGGTARLLADAVPARELHLFDTFGGMPATDSERDLHRAGDFADTGAAEVAALFTGEPGVHLHPGFFPASAAGLEALRFSFVHVDVDIYRSVLDCCAFFLPRLLPGGIALFDDYGFISCPGARSAVDEFFAGRRERPVYLPTGQVFVVALP